MRPSFLLVVCILAFLSQIIFSVYYSLAIVDQNTLINNQQQQLSQLNLLHEDLSNRLAADISLKSVVESSRSAQLVPVKDFLDLR